MKQIKMRVFIPVIIVFVTMFNLSMLSSAESYRDTIKTKLEYCASLNNELYQPKTWENLQKVIEDVKPYADASYGTDEEAYGKLIELNNSIVALKKLANLDVLKATIKNLNYLNEKEFKQESWANLLSVIVVAKKALADLNSSQITIDRVQNDLVIAQSKLIKMDGTSCNTVDAPNAKIKKDVLNASVYNVGYLEKNMFTESSWDIFILTYTVAKDILANPKVNQITVNQIQNDLVIAESNLEKKPISQYFKSNELLDFPANLRKIYGSDGESIVSSNNTSSESNPSSSVTSKPRKSSKSVSTSEVYDVGSTIILIVVRLTLICFAMEVYHQLILQM